MAEDQGSKTTKVPVQSTAELISQGIGTLCLLAAIPAGFFGTICLFSDIWGIIRIRTHAIPPPVEGPGLGIMIGGGLLFGALLLWGAGMAFGGSLNPGIKESSTAPPKDKEVLPHERH